MKPDLELCERILQFFQAQPSGVTDIRKVEEGGFSRADPKSVAHLEYLNKRGLIQRVDGYWGIGLEGGAESFPQWSVVDLRLTPSGQQFLQRRGGNPLEHYRADENAHARPMADQAP